MGYEFVSIEQDPKGKFVDEAVITVKRFRMPRFLYKLLDLEPPLIQYYGHSTVWREIATGKRAPLDLEDWFIARWSFWKRSSNR